MPVSEINGENIYTVRWVLTHDPIALFEEAARRFAEMVEADPNGRIKIEVFTPTEHGNGHWVPAADVAQQVADGDIEMSQTYTTQ